MTKDWKDAEAEADRDEAGRSERVPSFVGWLWILAAVIWAIAITVAGWAWAAGGAAPTMEQVDACAASSVICAPAEPVRVALTPERWRVLIETHRDERAAIGATCDCDCFTRHVIEDLVERGFPRGSIIWVDGWTADGRRHAWVAVLTDGGDQALDPLEPDPVSNVSHRARAACIDPNHCWRVQ